MSFRQIAAGSSSDGARVVVRSIQDRRRFAQYRRRGVRKMPIRGGLNGPTVVDRSESAAEFERGLNGAVRMSQSSTSVVEMGREPSMEDVMCLLSKGW